MTHTANPLYNQDTSCVMEADGAACTQADRGYAMVFFDLDGTLLSMDTSDFMHHYMGKLMRHCAGCGFDPQLTQQAHMAGISAMAKDDTPATNDQVFWTAFNAAMRLDSNSDAYQRIQDMFLSFYATEFLTIGQLSEVNPHIVKAVETIKGKGYRMAVATMPMFPLDAVHARVRWAGLAPEDFEFITHYESSASVKPKLSFYQECLDKAGVSPDEALMVGNNSREDGAATQLGIDLYLITDHLIRQEGGVKLSSVKHGTSADFVTFAQSLPALN